MRYLALILLLAFPAAAQVDGIVTTVSTTVNVIPDQAGFAASVSTTLDVTQQQVVQVFHDAGVQNLTVTGVAAGANGFVGNPFPPEQRVIPSQFSYQVTFTVPASSMQEFVKKLDAVRAKLPKGFNDLQYNATLSASQGVVDTAHQNALPQLLQAARSKAQALASAAGLRLGAVVGVNEGSPGVPSGFSVPVIVGTLGSFSSSTITFPGTQFTFFATVKYATQ